MGRSRQVWKFEVESGAGRGVPTIAMPRGAKLLRAEEIDDKVWVWAEVDPEAFHVGRSCGYWITGVPIPDGWVHVDTVVIKHSAEVIHVYHVPPPHGEN